MLKVIIPTSDPIWRHPQQLLADCTSLAAILLRNLRTTPARPAWGNIIKVSPDARPARNWWCKTAVQACHLMPCNSWGQRFSFRVLGTQQSGSGLGWSIVKRVARLWFAWQNPVAVKELGGLCVRVLASGKRVQQ